MRPIATRDSRVVRGSEALRNRMCDLNKYISLNICNGSSLLLSSNTTVTNHLHHYSHHHHHYCHFTHILLASEIVEEIDFKVSREKRVALIHRFLHG